MSLGGSASVRGYKDQQLTGDCGGYWRNDLRWSRRSNVCKPLQVPGVSFSWG